MIMATYHPLHTVNVSSQSELEKCCCISYKNKKNEKKLPAVAQLQYYQIGTMKRV